MQIHYSTRFRDTFCRQSLEDVEPLYRALKTFAGLIYDPRNLVEMQLKAGANSLFTLFTSSVCLIYSAGYVVRSRGRIFKI